MNMHFAAPGAQTKTLARGAALARSKVLTLQIVESGYVPNKDGTGMVLLCKAQTIGARRAQDLALRFELENANEKVQAIGQRDFAALRRATDVLAPTDSAELHSRPFKAIVADGRVRAYLLGDLPMYP